MIETIYKILFLLLLVLIFTYLLQLNIKQDHIIAEQNRINYNVSVIADQLKVDDLVIKN